MNSLFTKCLVALGLMVLGAPVLAANLLVNPQFDADPSVSGNGWTLSGTGNFTWRMDTGQPAAPSAAMDQNNGESMQLSQCVTIVGGTSYDFSAQSSTQSSFGAGSMNGVRLSVFSSLDCSGAPLDTVQATDFSFPNWALTSRSGYMAPGGAMSAQIELFSTAGPVMARDFILWDNVVLDGQPGAMIAVPVPITRSVPAFSLYGIAGLMLVLLGLGLVDLRRS
ncbi:MAG: hypothetical protein KDG50_03500 [Chromatiales bacterium]|nr:hypothetical protein [Chromatiales bacterium]